MKIAFITLGCKVNQYETEVLKKLFFNCGYEIVSNLQIADVYIINSCTVTQNSDFKIRSLTYKLKKINSKSILILAGCFAQAFKNSFQFFSNFDVVVGNSNKLKLPQILKMFLTQKKPLILIEPHQTTDVFLEPTISKFKHKFRAFIKIEDGCNRACSYCIIPKARGFVKSKPLKTLKNEVKELTQNGYVEIVLVGINVSSYGVDFNKKINFVDAVECVNEIKNVKRIRLGSLEPDLINEVDILKLSKIEKFCPNFHISVQSGCNEVLKRMGRKYCVNDYRKLVQLIFKFFKNPSITTDIMVGFAQETELEFIETLNFVHKINFLKVHIFPYSKRPGTVAALMSGQLTKAEKKVRVSKLKQVAGFEQKKFLKNQINKIVSVLFEKQEIDGLFVGHAENFILVKVASKIDLCGKIKFVKIIYSFDNYCFGIVIN